MSANNTDSTTAASQAVATPSRPQVLPELEDFGAADDGDSTFDDNSSTCVFMLENHRGMHANKYQWFDLTFVQRSSWPLREWQKISGCEGRQLQHSK